MSDKKELNIWQKYEKSRTYMNSNNILVNSERNWNMYLGNQWQCMANSEGLEDQPMLNMIKQIVKYKVSTVAQHSVRALFSDMNYQYADAASRLSDLFDISWEKAKMDRIAWKTLKASAIQGDAYVYWYSGDTRIKPQVLHNTQMHLGDENITDIQDQPWIIIEERIGVKVAKKRAKLAGCPKDEIDMILPDKDFENMFYNKLEVSNKVTSLIYLTRDEDGIINIARATKNVVYEDLHPIQQKKGGKLYGNGLTMYPIVPMIWEEMPNYARGKSEVDELLANQLALNKMMAYRQISTKQTSFPRMAVDTNSVANPQDLDKVGAVIKLNGGSSQAVSQMISYLSPMAQTGDARQLTEEYLTKTKDLAGASDTALGNIDLSRVSGTAATTIRDQQQVPLNEQVQMYQDFVENVALLWFDIWRAYNPEGIEYDGIMVTLDELNSIIPNVRVDIVENTTLSVMASQQELTNLFNNNKITFDEYVEAYPEHSSIPKDILLRIQKKRRQQMAQQPMQLDANGQPIINNEMPAEQVGGGQPMSFQDMQSLNAEGMIQ